MSSSVIPKSPAKPTIKSKYEKSNKKCFVNSLSAIPMFDKRRMSNGGSDLFQTSYREQYPESKMNTELDIHLADLTSKSLNFDSDGLSYADKYRLKKINSELLTSDSGFFSAHYKRPIIPAHIKKDACFQSNAERNISFLHTVYGIVPYVPSQVRPSPQQQQYRKHYNKADNHYKDMQTEAQSSYKQIAKGVTRAEIPEFIRKDNPYQTNNEKSIRHIRTVGPNSNIVSYVPTKDKYRLMLEKKTRESYDTIKESDPSMSKYKLVNEINATPMIFGYLSNYEPKNKLGNPDHQDRRNHSDIRT